MQCNGYGAKATKLSIPLWCDCNEMVEEGTLEGLRQLSIPLWCDCNKSATQQTALPENPFNPTMVRLQPYSLHPGECILLPFNPTMVRLQLMGAVEIAAWNRSFNPTMVRLQLEIAMHELVNELRLSIPLWCDCNEPSSALHLLFRFLSIPLWCDCNMRSNRHAAEATRLSIPLWCDCNANGGG